MNMAKQYETVIGLEVHVELATRTKIFCGCSTAFGGAPNTHICPVCTGMPGSLPVLNRRVVEYAIGVGLATGSRSRGCVNLIAKTIFTQIIPRTTRFRSSIFPSAEMDVWRSKPLREKNPWAFTKSIWRRTRGN